MTKIYVPANAGEEIVLYDGDERKSYKVASGSVDVDNDAHVSSILTSVPGATLKRSEPPAIPKTAAAPQKEK